MTQTFLSAVAATLLLPVAALRAADAPLVAVQTVALKGVDGKLDHLAVDVKGQRLFVANKPNNTLDVVDLKTGTMVKQIPGQGKVSGVDYAADIDMIYVGNGAGVCNGFDGKTYAQAFSTPAKGADNVHYYAATKSVYVAHGPTLTELDAKAGDIKAAIKLPGDAHGFAIDAAAGKIYVVVTKPSEIAVVDMAKRDVTARFPLTLSDAGSPITHDAANGLLFVGCPKKPVVVVFDAKTGKELDGIVIPAGIDDLHFDADRNRLYASCSDGILAVLEKSGGKFAVTTKVETPLNSRTCAWGGGKLYLGVPKAKNADGPEVRVFDAKPAVEAKK